MIEIKDNDGYVGRKKNGKFYCKIHYLAVNHIRIGCDLKLSRPPMKRKRAFSLIEVVLALGVVSFAFVGIVGLMPVGLKTFRTAMEMNMQSQLSQRIAGETQRSRFDDLKASDFSSLNFPQYFDDQGSPVASASDPNCLYTVDVASAPAQVKLPGSAVANTNILSLNFSIKKKTDSTKTNYFSVIVANTGI
ncbi:hypothetical protein BH09VER1_BH09VER1_03700 [soil metagenome]